MNKRKSGFMLPLTFIVIMAIIFGFNMSNTPCRQNGHTWAAATCTMAKHCSVCGETSGEPNTNNHKWEDATCTTPKTCVRCQQTYGEPLSSTKEHTWEAATCFSPQKCSVCGATTGTKLAHEYSSKGICSLCGETKPYGNSYGYFDESELYAMAKDAIKDFCYPTYVNNFCSSANIKIEKVTDDRLGYGKNCFSVVAAADFSSGGTVTTKGFVAVIEPHTSTTYAFVDAYVE